VKATNAVRDDDVPDWTCNMTINAKPVETHWASPISVRIGNGHSELIHGPDEALHYFRHRWPLADSLVLDTARRRCLEARGSGMPCEAAKESVIAAAIEAKVLA
jgi:hypothetical protein